MYRLSNFFLPVILFSISISAIFWRVGISADFSDESYYALFIHDWLLVGIRESSLLPIHQTAALFVFPIANIYKYINGGTDALIFFFRLLYLSGSVFSAGIWTYAMFRLGWGQRSWISGLLILVFVPYGLPAPSYNTIALQGVVIALSSFALSEQQKYNGKWLILSASAWSMAIISYPPIIISFIIFNLLYAYNNNNYYRLIFIALINCTFILALFCISVYFISIEKFIEGFYYTSIINNTSGFTGKLLSVREIILGNNIFLLLFAISALFGLYRRHISPKYFSIVIIFVLLCLHLSSPSLFVFSHDAMFILAVSGIGILADIRSSDSGRRHIALIYATSMAAGIATSLFATHTLYSFPIGATAAAAISLVWVPDSARKTFLLPLAGTIICASILWTSVTFRYGETPKTREEERQFVQAGAFAGLSIPSSDSRLLEAADTAFNDLINDGDSVAIIGRVPGLMLQSKAHIAMLTTFPLMPDVPAEGLAKTKKYYDNAENRPDVIVLYKDIYFTPVNYLENIIEEFYSLEFDFSDENRTLRFYRQRE